MGKRRGGGNGCGRKRRGGKGKGMEGRGREKEVRKEGKEMEKKRTVWLSTFTS